MITLDDAILWLSESGFQKEIEDKTFFEGDSSIKGIPVGTNFFFVDLNIPISFSKPYFCDGIFSSSCCIKFI